MKETEDNTKKWKDTLGSLMGRINIVKMSICPKQSIDLMQSLLKNLIFFRIINNPKIYTEPQKIPGFQSNLERKKKSTKLDVSCSLTDYTTKLQ